ncbi:dolichyl-diphosphooligosaccharide--protein glycosyltransferase subunit STT3 [Methanobacterium alcaliphilum]|uniref:dolichyl-diphosphooligosaccharide--protein glycosyltransferase subunit STT3 n=1 Tax=Methanobacterium alcaliphilum TaxID=392018 RepID=UPI00200A8F7C|nr:dolichyl-diphosphooligosaccharide--protein glycosyltransferase subunit STT3 [Methanobacterium alcaliphilum]MCK9150660.1 dolichyl-diphosphooligosaccharide--protein glycosyltransferase subunit STT3 [Methanobacterium alcaliphilum]
MNFSSNQFLFIFVSVVFILSIGIFIRMDSIGLEGVSLDKKEFYKDTHGQQYMYDMDSYYNYRLSNNLLKNGALGDAVYQNIEWDLHSYYPPGVPLDYPPLIAYLTVFIYKLISIFHQTELINVCFFIPAFIAPLAGIFVLFFIYRMKNDTNGFLGGLAAGLLMVCAPFYFMRTVPGFFDTDMFNLLFPIIIVWFLFEAIRANEKEKQVIFTGLSSIFMLFFALAWNGWQFLYFMILIAALIFYISQNLKKQVSFSIKNKSHIPFIFLLLSLIIIVLVNGVENLIKIASGPIETLKLTSNYIWYPWPDPYNFISELQPPELLNVLWGLGPGLIVAGVMGIVILVYNYFKESSKKAPELKFLMILLIIWTIASILSLFKGIRFEIMLIAPLSIGAGIFIYMLGDYLDKVLYKTKERRLNYSNLIFIILLIGLLVVPSVLIVQENYKNLTPRANDNLWDSAVWIKENTTNNTVIISNWVHGHFFATVSDRPVDFDGRLGYIETLPVRSWQYQGSSINIKTPNVYREYWQDKVFSTSNITLSKGILRMLATSGDNAYLTLEEYTQNPAESVKILEDILGLDKDQAYSLLTKKYLIPSQTAHKLLDYTHPSQENPYIFVTYDSLIEKGYWIFYYSNWDFKKAKGIKTIYSPGYLIRKDSNLLVYDNDLLVNLSRENATWQDKKPAKLVIIQEDEKEKIIEPDSDFNIYILLNNDRSIVLDKKFENSVFVKLVLEQDINSEFKLLYKKGDVHLWKGS